MEGIWRKLSGRNRYHKLSTDEENTAVQRTDPTTTAAISADFENADDVIEDHQISSWSAFWNVCNSIQGVAILAMPYVIKGGGIWSILSIVVVAAISNYTGQILIKCHYDDVIDEDRGDSVRMRTRASYAEVGEAIWPEYGKQVVLFVQVLELLFMATLYPIVTVSILHTLIPTRYIPSGMWVLLFGLVIYPNVFLRKLYYISYMSTLTVVSAGVVTAVIVLYCFTSVSSWHMGQMLVLEPKEFIAAIGVVVASYSSQMYLSVIENSMKNPDKVGTVMNCGYAAMTLLKIGIGVVAYFTFGADTSQVVTLNLPSGVLLTAVNIVVLLMALSSYTLPMFTVFEILEKDSPLFSKAPADDGKAAAATSRDELFIETVRRVGIRSALVLVTLVMAVSVPHFCLFLSFIGCFTGCFLEIVFPCAFYVILKYEKLSTAEIIFNVFLIAASLMFMSVGMYYSGLAIGKAFRLHTKEVWTVE